MGPPEGSSKGRKEKDAAKDGNGRVQLADEVAPARDIAGLAFDAVESLFLSTGKNVIERGEKRCTHEVVYPEAPEFSDAPTGPPPPRPGPPAKEYAFQIDPFQDVAINALETGHSVLVAAHTSAGKTVVAQYAFAMAMRDNFRAVYTSPLKALSNQKYRELQEEFGDVGLMTGDVTINPDAHCLVMTTEILRSMLYNGSDLVRQIRLVVYDEIHYLRDRERGVVWEESIVLAPPSVRFAFLSATIPNAREFAEWVTRSHGSPCHVVYTDYRPTPLQHYVHPSGSDGLYLVVDEKSNFREDNFQKAIAEMSEAAVTDTKRQEKEKKGSDARGDIHKIVRMIMERNYDPVIVFAFSKRRVEALAGQTTNLDLNSDEEKRLVEAVFWNALDCLSPEDRKLPQVSGLLHMLRRGVGVHHSGLLPILKEVVEILFQEGLLKALFATETMSTGLNMPAKTVVFTSPRKFDGGAFRWITSGEYIQMSGRAGRRGLDDRGVVILMLDAKMEPAVCRDMVKGAPDLLWSEFHLGYNMLLNMMRLEGNDPESLMRRSFRQFQTERALPAIEKRIVELSQRAEQCQVEEEDACALFLDTLHQLVLHSYEERDMVTQPRAALPFLQPGRLVEVACRWDESGETGAAAQVARIVSERGAGPSAAQGLRGAAVREERVWGVVVNFELLGNGAGAPGKKRKRGGEGEGAGGGDGEEGDGAEQVDKRDPANYVVDVLVMCRADSVGVDSRDQGRAARAPVPVDAGCGDGVPVVTPVRLSCLGRLSAVRVYIPKDLRAQESRALALKSVAEVQRRFAGEKSVPLLDPADDMKVDAKQWRRHRKARKELEEVLDANPVAGAEDLPSRLQLLAEKRMLKQQLRELKKQAKAAKALIMKDELHARTRVLVRLGFLDDARVVTLKGRAAAEVASADELVATELLFSGALGDLPDDLAVALLSCLVWTERAGKAPARVRPDLQAPLSALRECARRVGTVQADCRLPVDVDAYVESFRPDLMEAVLAWYRGSRFAEVLKMADVFEGSMVRAIRRLEELLRQLAQACDAVGDVALAERLRACNEHIKRDIVFAASLYL